MDDTKKEFLDILVSQGRRYILTEDYLSSYLFMTKYLRDLHDNKSSLIFNFFPCMYEIGLTDNDLGVINNGLRTYYLIYKKDTQQYYSLRGVNKEEVFTGTGNPNSVSDPNLAARSDSFTICYYTEAKAQEVLDQLNDPECEIKCKRSISGDTELKVNNDYCISLRRAR